MKKVFLVIILIIANFLCKAQQGNPTPNFSFYNNLNIGRGAQVNNGTSAWLEIGNLPTTKCVILPRITDTTSITSPVVGDFAFVLRDSSLYFYTRKWNKLLSSGEVGNQQLTFRNDTLYISNGNNVVFDYATNDYVDSVDEEILTQLNSFLPKASFQTALDTILTLSDSDDVYVTPSGLNIGLIAKVNKSDSNKTGGYVTKRYADSIATSLEIKKANRADTNNHGFPITLDYFNSNVPIVIDTTSLDNRINKRVKYTDSGTVYTTQYDVDSAKNNLLGYIGLKQNILGFLPVDKADSVNGYITHYQDDSAKRNIMSYIATKQALLGYVPLDRADSNQTKLGGYTTLPYVNSRITALTTTNIPEGTNLYFTDVRVYNDSTVYLSYVKTLIAGKVGYGDTGVLVASKYDLDTGIRNTRVWANGRFLTSYTETDPIYSTSIAANLTALDTTHYNTAWLKYIVSGSYSGGIITFTRNDGTTFTVTGLPQGTVTSVTAGTGLSGGAITSTGTISMPNVGTAGTYGDATHIPSITTDAQGRISGVTTYAITTGGVQSVTAGRGSWTSGITAVNVGLDTTQSYNWLAPQTITNTGLAATMGDGVVLQNTTAATSGTTSQYSPVLHLKGNAWKSNTTAASQTQEWGIYCVPVAGTSTTTSKLRFDFNPNGGGWNPDVIYFNSAGNGFFNNLTLNAGSFDAGGGNIWNGNISTTNNSAFVEANFYAVNGKSSSQHVSTPDFYIGTGTTVQYRGFTFGKTATTLNPSEDFSNFTGVGPSVTGASSGTSNQIANWTIKPISFTPGVGTATNIASLLITGASNGATNNYALQIKSAFNGSTVLGVDASGNISNATWAGNTIAYNKLNLAGSISISDFSATGTPSSSTFLRGDNTWATPAGGGSVTSVTSANGDATVTNTTSTPQITINSAPKWSTARNLAGNSVDGSANVAFANKFIVQGTTDAGLSGAQFLGALGTGIVKNTITTGVLSIAVAADFPILNQSTTGSAATLTTPRTIGGVSFDGSANITVSTATSGFTVSGGDLALGTNNITITGSLGSTGSRLTKGWFTDLQVTNAINGSVTGNAATVTTNANLTGVVTSSGNTTSIAAGAITNAMLTNSVVTVNGTSIGLGGSGTVTAAAGTLTGTTLNGSVVTSSLTSIGNSPTMGTAGTTSGSIVSINGTQTLTNKWFQPRTGTTTSSATPTINTDNVDQYSLTAQTANITSFTTNLSGTPVAGQMLIIEVTGTGAGTIAWGTSFENGNSASLPTTFSTTMSGITLKWNAITSKWRCVGTY